MRLRSLSLTTWIMLGFVFGVITGLIFGDFCSVLKPFSEAFIKIWQITILPSVVLSLIVGIGSLKRDSARAIAVKAGLVLLLFWTIGVGIFFSFQLAFPPREAASFFSPQALAGNAGLDIIDQFIPTNPFQTLSEGIIPATVLFCLFLGFALMMDDGSGPILNSLRILLDALTRMTSILSRTFPIGVFVITASTAGTMTIEGFLDLQVFLCSLAAATILLGLVVLPLLVTCFTTFRYREILAASSRAVILALSTGSEFITLPLIIEGVRKLFEGPAGVSIGNGVGGDVDRPDDHLGDRTGEEQSPEWKDIRSYSELLVPVAYTFPLLGALTPFLFILFVAWLYQSPPDLMQQVQLVAVGIPTFFGSSKLSVVSLLNLMHLPADAYNLYISMGILRQCCVAALSCMSIFSFATISIALVTNRGRLRWRRAIPSVLLILLLTVLMIVGLKAGFSLLLANTYHGDDQISRMELPLDSDGRRLDDVVNTTVYLRSEDVPVIIHRDSGGGDDGGDDVKMIRERGVLRVGYNGNNLPFVFFNGKGELVGYDVQMAYDLARVINVPRLEFVPITGANLADSLDSGYCDIVMSSVMVNSARLDAMKFTDPYVTVHMSFVVPDEQKQEFSKLSDVKKMNSLRVAVFNNTALTGVAKRLFPAATIIPIDSKEEFFVEKKADSLFIPAEEGYTMTMLYPFYDVAIIEPNNSYEMMYGYAVAMNSSDTYLMGLNYWLKMEGAYGKLEQKYDYWILGKNAVSVEPRWSVVRNVLHWVN